MEENYDSVTAEQQIPASEHPKAWDPRVLILAIPLCLVGAIIGMELIVRTGVTPNTSIIGALFAILLSRIPIEIFRKYRSIHRQNLLQTSISAATFSAANCMILPIGIPFIMGRTDLVIPMLIGCTLATIIDATIMYNCFGTEMFPAEGSWPPGVASAESILAVVEKGKKAVLLLVGIGIGVVGKIGTIPMDLLGVSSIEDCRELANKLWTANYIDDGAATSKLAASLWMNDEVAFKQDTIDTLAKDYYAASYQGDMADPAYSAAFKDWLNDNTGGLLKDAVNNLEDFDPETVMALATTVYFSANWSDKFSEANTFTETFHGAVSDKDADFMHRSSTGQYFYSEHFAAVSLPFEDAGSMWLLLPDEGVTPADLLKSGEAMDFVLSGGAKGAESTFLKIDMAVPKFDVEADMDLAEKLTALGAGSMFTNKADFSNLTDMDGVFIGSATHDARVKVDEEGCEAAAFTAIMYCGTAMPPDERVEFKLDRPFLFALMGIDGLPLFYGVVNQL